MLNAGFDLSEYLIPKGLQGFAELGGSIDKPGSSKGT